MILKEKIIQESLRQFSTKGYMSTSINDLLEAVGTSKGGLYNHFKSKEDLFFTALIEAAISGARGLWSVCPNWIGPWTGLSSSWKTIEIITFLTRTTFPAVVSLSSWQSN